MSKGCLRNQSCPNGCRKIGKTKQGVDLDLGPQKYKKCCWGKDYWDGFTKVTRKFIDKKTGEEKEIEGWVKTSQIRI